ncbi:hypothetical protein [Pseudonocardia humida]|uniref:Uncharacterized protein n=1 Tax=Pseudonocardia humida TaxID=2800819 RepID=A0ABT0ZTE1_9PSEU|nr:hypothetical protein [Pseudonocardia humida]MCO1653991.1 hypothetical protein [Pseudonocardia humida]
MSAYRLQARRAIGGPGRRKEETRLAEADDLDTATGTARALAADGFTVWIFRRADRPRLSAAPHPLRLVTTIDPPQTEADDRRGRPERRPVRPVVPTAHPVAGPVALDEQRALRRAR